MKATGLIDIDHLMISVGDSQCAGERFERMGFTVTPRSVLPGMSNRLICFPARQPNACNFIELMALDDPATAPFPMPAILQPPGRPVSMVMAAPDIEVTDVALRELGLAMPPPLHFTRDWTLPGGEVVSPAFAVLIPEPGQSPYYWNVCQHKTPQHYLRHDFVGHPNGVAAFIAVIGVAAEPKAAAEHYRRVWGAEVLDGDPVRVSVGAVELRLYSRAALAAAFPAFDIGGDDGLIGFVLSHPEPSALAGRLRDAGLSSFRNGAALYLPSAEAEGNLMVVEPRRA